jgi:hypothetical protein
VKRYNWSAAIRKFQLQLSQVMLKQRGSKYLNSHDHIAVMTLHLVIAATGAPNPRP